MRDPVSSRISAEHKQPGVLRRLSLGTLRHHANEEAELERLRRHRAGEAASGWSYHIETTTTEFGIVEKGMRLPGKVELLRERYDMTRSLDGWGEDKRVDLWVQQDCSDYRFFGIDTEALLEDRTDGRP